MPRRFALSLPDVPFIKHNQVLYKLSKHYIDHLKFPDIPKTPDPSTSSPHEQLTYITEILQPKSSVLTCDLYNYLIENLTPKHFLSDSSFDLQIKKFYICEHGTQACQHEDSFYEDPKNLTQIGKLRVWLELKRLEITYIQKYSTILNILSRKVEILLPKNVFLALYLYTTNLGYKKINSQLRFGHSHGCEDLICLINQGIERLGRFPEFQLNLEQHKLIRYMNLPEDVLRNIVKNTLAMNSFLDKAFLSTSFNKSGAGEFSINSNFELIVKTNGYCHGAKIDGISPFPSEGEYLFSPGTKFECHPQESIIFDNARNKWMIYVCAISFGSVAQTVTTVLRAAKLFKKPLQVKTDDEAPISPMTPIEPAPAAARSDKPISLEHIRRRHTLPPPKKEDGKLPQLRRYAEKGEKKELEAIGSSLPLSGLPSMKKSNSIC